MKDFRFHVWDGDTLHELEDEGLMSLIFENGGWRLIVSRQSIGAQLICHSQMEDAELLRHTGFTDRNGDPIYDRDLVEAMWIDGTTSLLEVRWDTEHGQWSCWHHEQNQFITALWHVTERIEVVGNKFRNRDLLRQSSQKSHE